MKKILFRSVFILVSVINIASAVDNRDALSYDTQLTASYRGLRAAQGKSGPEIIAAITEWEKNFDRAYAALLIKAAHDLTQLGSAGEQSAVKTLNLLTDWRKSIPPHMVNEAVAILENIGNQQAALAIRTRFERADVTRVITDEELAAIRAQAAAR